MQLQAVTSSAFNREFNEGLVHQVVTAYQAAGRQGTKAQKTRREVSGGGAKPWKQKGTGRARAGTTRSPIWRKGGITFAAKPRCFEQKVNRKMYQAAMLSILSELVRQERLFVVESINLSAPKTRELVNQLKQAGLEQVLIITDEVNENLFLASRNLAKVEVIQAASIDPVSLIAYEKIVITAAALKKVEEKLA